MSGTPAGDGRVLRVRVSVGAQPIRPGVLLEGIGGDADGGVVLFVGRVRDENEGRRVRTLEYEAYGAMAEEELERIAVEMLDRFAIGELRAVHRIGSLTPGEASVAVAAAAPHRADAFAACRAAMEEIKHRLPVWKLETYEDGESRWLEGTAPGAADAEPPGDAPGGGALAGRRESASTEAG